MEFREIWQRYSLCDYHYPDRISTFPRFLQALLASPLLAPQSAFLTIGGLSHHVFFCISSLHVFLSSVHIGGYAMVDSSSFPSSTVLEDIPNVLILLLSGVWAVSTTGSVRIELRQHLTQTNLWVHVAPLCGVKSQGWDCWSFAKSTVNVTKCWQETAEVYLGHSVLWAAQPFLQGGLAPF